MSNRPGPPLNLHGKHHIPANGYAVLNHARLKQLDELMYRLAHPDNGLAGAGVLTVRVQEGKLRFARPVPFPYFMNFPDPPAAKRTARRPAGGLKMITREMSENLDRMLAYLVRWGNGDLYIFIPNGEYQGAIPVPDIEVEF